MWGQQVVVENKAGASNQIGAAFVAKSEQPAVLLDTIGIVAAGRMVFPYMDVRAINERIGELRATGRPQLH